jgi:hypothetical protein
MNSLTIYILASTNEKPYIEAFWKHTGAIRRQMPGVQWASPLYLERQIQGGLALVPSNPHKYIVIGCLSRTFLSLVLDEPAVREMITGADRAIPFLISDCDWNEWPSPFRGKKPFAKDAVARLSSARQESLFVNAVQQLRDLLRAYFQEGR